MSAEADDSGPAVDRVGRHLQARWNRRPPLTEGKLSPSGAVRTRLAVLGVLIVAAVGLGMAFRIPTVGGMAGWIHEAGPMGWITATVALALVLTVPAPRSALSVLAGAVAGFPAGFTVVVVGGLAGGLLGFSVSRWLGRGAATRLLGTRLDQMDRLARERGFLTVLTARLLPAPPFAVVSYIAGLSGVRVAPYAAGTIVGLLPGSLFYVGVGASATGAGSWLIRLGSPLHAFIALAAVLAMIAAWRLRRRR